MFSGKFNLIFSEILMFNFTSSTDSDCTNDYKYLCTSNQGLTYCFAGTRHLEFFCVFPLQ